MVSISRSIFLACGTTDIEQPMIHIRLYRERGQYVESINKKEGKKNTKKKKKGEKNTKKREKEKEKTHVQ
jgi:hypothetical protein